jgi:thiosulfate/3-mercaptopyruvate sulfurtransferase
LNLRDERESWHDEREPAQRREDLRDQRESFAMSPARLRSLFVLFALPGFVGCVASSETRHPEPRAASQELPASTATRPEKLRAGVPGVIGTEELAVLLDRGELSVVDVRADIATYLEAHIPGAVYLHTESLRSSSGGVPNLILPARSYETLFARLGISMNRMVAIYGSGESRNIDATYVAWILAGFGHAGVRVLDGGFMKWQQEGRGVTPRYPDISGSDFSAPGFAPERAVLEDVRRAIGSRRVVLVDARSPEQYDGREGAQMRRGHIPGAINHFWQRDLVEGEFARVWKSREDLRASYVGEGITPDKEIIAYCNGGLESSHVYFTLRALLGYPRVRVYDGSWTEWAEREELPIETGSRPRSRPSIRPASGPSTRPALERSFRPAAEPPTFPSF